ncbi:MAG: MerR family transcriptional regulator [Myxococcaceae bacterium]|jgi:DNA-binding transcriptional MerR regulator|nr:MerR family transcriptional regulator [Myxococcaceae bacterium]
MLIHDLARETGFSVETIRYYERLGLIRPPTRRANGYRDYAPSVVPCLHLCRYAKELGFSLREIRALGERLDAGALSRADARQAVVGKLAEVERRLVELRALRASLRSALTHDDVFRGSSAGPASSRRRLGFGREVVPSAAGRRHGRGAGLGREATRFPGATSGARRARR